jgi:hypothetical protein
MVDGDSSHLQLPAQFLDILSSIYRSALLEIFVVFLLTFLAFCVQNRRYCELKQNKPSHTNGHTYFCNEWRHCRKESSEMWQRRKKLKNCGKMNRDGCPTLLDSLDEVQTSGEDYKEEQHCYFPNKLPTQNIDCKISGIMCINYTINTPYPKASFTHSGFQPAGN